MHFPWICFGHQVCLLTPECFSSMHELTILGRSIKSKAVAQERQILALFGTAVEEDILQDVTSMLADHASDG